MTRDEYNDIYLIVGATMEVYNELGRGLEESVYQAALEEEFKIQNIPYSRESVLHTFYKGIKLHPFYKPDFLCFGSIVLELKSVSAINSDHRAQLFNYMRISKVKFGILTNFGSRQLINERYMYDEIDDDFILITKDNLKDLIN